MPGAGLGPALRLRENCVHQRHELLDAIEIIDEADNGETALLKISSTKPDIVFLDIQMPVMDGFELLEHLNSAHLPAIVMVTAYDQHAMRAFEAGAVDYLLNLVVQSDPWFSRARKTTPGKLAHPILKS